MLYQLSKKNYDFLAQPDESTDIQSYKDEIKIIIEQFNQSIRSFLITGQTNSMISNIFDVFFNSECKNDNPENRKHIIIVFCENSAGITTIPVEYFLNENNNAKQKVVIFVDSFFLYDLMFQILIGLNAEILCCSGIKQIHSEFLLNIVIPS